MILTDQLMAHFIQQQNPQKKFLLDYVIESDDDNNLMSFLLPTALKDSPGKATYLKMFNQQLQMTKGITLFEHYLDICTRRKTMIDEKFLIVFSLLEEIGTIEDIEEDVGIDDLLEKAIKGSVNNECLELTDNLLGNIVAYWTPNDPNYQHYKEKFLSSGQLQPLYEMLFDVIEEDNDAKFVYNYYENLKKLQACFKARYGVDSNTEHLTTNCLFVIVKAAIFNNRRKIIDHILKHDNFEKLTLKFPPNTRTSEAASYFALKMFENGYEMGRGNVEIPNSWITPEILKEFLDSRFKHYNDDLIEFDCNFLLHNYTKQVQVKSAIDVEDNPRLIFWEDTKVLENIIKSSLLRKCITHPVIATYIDLKKMKFQWIYWLNLLLYFTFFIVPLTLLAFSWYDPGFAYISVVFLLLRELVQFCCIENRYFEILSNKFEVVFIFVSLAFVVTFHNRESWKVDETLLGFCSVIMTLASSFDFLVSLRFSAPFFQFLLMFKTVLDTSAKYLWMNSIILVPYTLSFCILFTKDATYPNDQPENFENFHFFSSAFIKIFMMMSGEFAIEPHKLNGCQKLFLLIFVLTTFMLFNQYLAVLIVDIEKRSKDTRYLMLLQNAEDVTLVSDFCHQCFTKCYKSKG